MCTQCKACADICPKKAIDIIDEIDKGYALIDETLCINCKLCEEVCQVTNPTKLFPVISWHQGWANDSIRRNSSSGGFASAIIKSFVQQGGFVSSCILHNGEFVYETTNEVENLQRFVGSKYVKSNPLGTYIKIKKLLMERNSVLFVGLPCHAAALRNFTSKINCEKLFIIDLICHGSPSPQLLKMALEDYGVKVENVSNISFRQKGQFSLKSNAMSIVPRGVQDRYTIGFLDGLFYTENCYSCIYARTDRVGDLTIGDSWGTDLVDESENGVSLALCQNSKGKQLLDSAELELFPVDIEKAIEANKQLKSPAKEMPQRKSFFQDIKKGKGFRVATFKALPKRCFRQGVKGFLIKRKTSWGGEKYCITYEISSSNPLRQTGLSDKSVGTKEK